MGQDIFQKIESAPSVDLGSILTRSFELVKKVWTEAILHALIPAILTIPLVIIIYIPLMPFYLQSFRRSSYYYYDDYYYNEPFLEYSPIFIILYFLFIFVLSFLAQTLSVGIAAHFYRALRKADLDSDEDIGGYFHFLKGKHLVRIFVLSLAVFGIALIATLLCFLPILYAMVPLQLVVVMYAFNEDMSIQDIIKACFKLGTKYWLILFVLILVSGVIGNLGIIICVIGVIVTAYFVHLPMYYFYKDTIGFEDSDPPGDSILELPEG